MTYGAVPNRIVNDFPSSGPTIITSMFMHGGIAHIIGNMVFLFVLPFQPPAVAFASGLPAGSVGAAVIAIPVLLPMGEVPVHS
jgi:hypothetical protein